MTLSPRLRDRARARLDRQFAALDRRVPGLRRFTGWLRARRARLIRVPVAILLILGGLLSFLPVLGIWMLPFGLLLLAIDLPFLQGPVSAATIRARRWIEVRLRRRRRA